MCVYGVFTSYSSDIINLKTLLEKKKNIIEVVGKWECVCVCVYGVFTSYNCDIINLKTLLEKKKNIISVVGKWECVYVCTGCLHLTAVTL